MNGRTLILLLVGVLAVLWLAGKLAQFGFPSPLQGGRGRTQTYPSGQSGQHSQHPQRWPVYGGHAAPDRWQDDSDDSDAGSDSTAERLRRRPRRVFR